MAAPSCTSPSATRTACRWSRRGRPPRRARRERRSISPTRAMSAMPAASTWASATISSRWRWHRSAWRWSPTGAPRRITQRLAMLTDRIADGVHGLDVAVPERRVRAPHILCLGFRDVHGKCAGRGAGRRRHLRGAAARPHAHLAPRLQRRGRCRPVCRGAGPKAARLARRSRADRIRDGRDVKHRAVTIFDCGRNNALQNNGLSPVSLDCGAGSPPLASKTEMSRRQWPDSRQDVRQYQCRVFGGFRPSGPRCWPRRRCAWRPFWRRCRRRRRTPPG